MKLTTKLAFKLFPPYVWVAVRKELFINKCTRQARSAANKAKIEQAKKQQDLRIQLGCGKNILQNWINVDIYRAEGIDIQLNFRNPLPFETGSVSLIFSEHVFEHLFKDEVERLLKECFRVLKKGGILRLGVPDAEIYFRKYIDGDREYFSRLKHLGGATEPLETPIDVINQLFRMGGDHLFAWDMESLKLATERAGFRRIIRYEPGNASIEALRLDDPKHSFGTLYIEATKE
jgi:predicted SAM-dependent methyltransferase